MRQPAALFPIALALGAIVLVPEASAREPLPIKACQTISQPGSYELANNLTATGDCLVIAASFVTIDLAGFSISTTNGAAIRATPPAGRLFRGSPCVTGRSPLPLGREWLLRNETKLETLLTALTAVLSRTCGFRQVVMAYAPRASCGETLS